jgi:virginiamycin B lyase
MSQENVEAPRATPRSCDTALAKEGNRTDEGLQVVRDGSREPSALGEQLNRRPLGVEARPARRLRALAPLALAAVTLAALTLAARADAFVYWTDSNSIGRANLDSNGNVLSVDQNFIKGIDFAQGLAVDREHVYWSSDAIGQANIDGSGVNNNFIPGADVFSGVAVNGADLYWANHVSPGTIGHADIGSSGNASNVNHGFITGANIPVGVATDSAHVYWANQGTIGRANRDGTGVDQSFVPLAGIPQGGVAVDATNIYWVDYSSVGIKRGMLADPLGTMATLIPIPGNGVDPFGVAVDNTHIYWAQQGTDTIGRANLNGSGADHSFISLPAGSGPTAIAVDALTAACGGQEATVVGTGRADKLRGTNGDDVVAAGDGADRVVGLRGDDLVCGAAGADTIQGKGGDDELRGGRGSDRCRGGGGSDSKHSC